MSVVVTVGVVVVVVIVVVSSPLRPQIIKKNIINSRRN